MGNLVPQLISHKKDLCDAFGYLTRRGIWGLHMSDVLANTMCCMPCAQHKTWGWVHMSEPVSHKPRGVQKGDPSAGTRVMRKRRTMTSMKTMTRRRSQQRARKGLLQQTGTRRALTRRRWAETTLMMMTRSTPTCPRAPSSAPKSRPTASPSALACPQRSVACSLFLEG